jgi:predicted  nucleic acid-binding Zn-ribbon protein
MNYLIFICLFILSIDNFFVFLQHVNYDFKMDKVESLVSAIDYKSRKIVEQNGYLKIENSVLKERILTLESQILETIEQNKHLEEKIKQINIGIITHSDIAESKTKINELVRKINKCITMITSDND